MATDVTVKKTSRLYIQDRRSKQKFLIDTGSEVSVIPTSSHRHIQSELTLYAVNNSPIKTHGQKVLQVDLNLRKLFRWPFIVADVPQAIIGADFLKHYHLSPHLAQHRLVDLTTHRHANCVQT